MTMQRPSGGCSNCGGPVRTYKSGHGWTCAKCVRLQKRWGPPRVVRLDSLDPATQDVVRAILTARRNAAERAALVETVADETERAVLAAFRT